MNPQVPLRSPARPLANPMRVAVSGPAFARRPELESYVELRLLSALGYLARRVERVAVRGDTIDVGPSRGAIQCRVWARLFDGRQLRETQLNVDPYQAIDGATEALARDVEYVESRLPPGEAHRCA